MAGDTSLGPALLRLILALALLHDHSALVTAFFLDLDLARLSSAHECSVTAAGAPAPGCPPDQYCDESPLTQYVPFTLFGDSLFRRECRRRKDLLSVCLRNDMCVSGKCEMGRCVECKSDADCPAGSNMYCGGSVQWALTQVDSFFGFALGRSFANFLNPSANTCSLPKEVDDFCLRDLECASGACDLAQCTDNSTRECYADHDCGHRDGGHFCAGSDNGLERNHCAPKGDDGSFCRVGDHCRSGVCERRQCRRDTSAEKCRRDKECGGGRFCFQRTSTLGRGPVSGCRSKGRVGSSCGGDSHCLSAICENQRCAECRSDRECHPRYEFCGRQGLTRLCQKKKCRGFCSDHSSCVSGVCTLFLCDEPGTPCDDSARGKKSESFADNF